MFSRQIVPFSHHMLTNTICQQVHLCSIWVHMELVAHLHFHVIMSFQHFCNVILRYRHLSGTNLSQIALSCMDQLLAFFNFLGVVDIPLLLPHLVAPPPAAPPVLRWPYLSSQPAGHILIIIECFL